MDRVLHVDASLLEQVGQLANVVLRLRDGHPVAGDDDDLARERELTATSSAVVARTVRPSSARAVPAAGLHLPERAEEDVRDRAVHRLRHEQREQRARRADEHPRDDQDGRVEHEARRRGGEAGERVQERDHDRHVGAADRQHEHHAEERARARQRRRAPTAPRRRRSIATPSADRAPSRTSTLTMFWPGNMIGRPLMSSCSFANATSEPANEIEPISAESDDRDAPRRQARTPRACGTRRARPAPPRRRRPR